MRIFALLPIILLGLGYIFYKIVIKKETSDWRETTGLVAFFMTIISIVIF